MLYMWCTAKAIQATLRLYQPALSKMASEVCGPNCSAFSIYHRLGTLSVKYITRYRNRLLLLLHYYKPETRRSSRPLDRSRFCPTSRRVAFITHCQSVAPFGSSPLQTPAYLSTKFPESVQLAKPPMLTRALQESEERGAPRKRMRFIFKSMGCTRLACESAAVYGSGASAPESPMPFWRRHSVFSRESTSPSFLFTASRIPLSPASSIMLERRSRVLELRAHATG